MSAISQHAIAEIDLGDSVLTLTTQDGHGPFRLDAVTPPALEDRVGVRSLTQDVVPPAEACALCEAFVLGAPGALEADGGPQIGSDPVWHRFTLHLTNGRTDRVTLRLDAPDTLETACTYLKCVWPVLRQDCLNAPQSTDMAEVDPFGPAWNLLDRVDMAMILLDRRCRLYRLNVAAREMLDAGQPIARDRGSIGPSNPDDQAAFKTAVRAMATARDTDGHVVFLTSPEDGRRMPLTLSRYFHHGVPTQYVLAMVPVPPSPARVEDLVRQMGLTSSEARVAALLQLGLSNREAAKIAGVRPETFNTYAKRVLNKLNVSCRTEMAQMLTWQAAGGRSA
ncbi:helix-turn-helix transcriptional regulator [Aliishimia ponticola]|nr:helix-turn-helix transcriptional regulator [Aliishimia ponticola]